MQIGLKSVPLALPQMWSLTTATILKELVMIKLISIESQMYLCTIPGYCGLFGAEYIENHPVLSKLNVDKKGFVR